MNVLLINTLPIPSGEASVNRFLSFARGLTELGDNVLMLSSGVGDGKEHHIRKIKYLNLNKYAFKRFGLLVSLFKMMSYIIKNKDINVVHVTSSSPLLLVPLWMTCRARQIPYILEKSEYPFILLRGGLKARLFGWISIHTLYKLFDGMVIMTQPLLNFYSPLVKKSCKFVKIPMTVEMSRFEGLIIPNSIKKFGDYAAYCGNMSGNKDGVENLIEAFSYVEKEYPSLKLLLIGGTNNQQDLFKLKHKTTALGLNNVVFVGRISRDDIPFYLSNAKMLCLARPSSLQSEGGFPTKLGEYLSTGKPVVVTAVGEIPSYLDETNSFIVRPDDNLLFAKQMLRVLSDYEEACRIGLEGRKVVERCFDIRMQGQKLHDFYSSF